MAKYNHFLRVAMTAALVAGMVAPATIARADLLDDLLSETTTKSTNPSSTTSSSTTSGTVGGTVAAPTIVPAATPLVVAGYSTEPLLLESGSRFELSLSVNNPGKDSAEDVVVQIGPSTEEGWGSQDELTVLGSGSAKYVGTIAAGATNNNATFKLMANPSTVGGLRSIPVKMTWKAAGYEHTSSAVVGLLINSRVVLTTSIKPLGTAFETKPFGATFRITNATSRTVKDVLVSFSGKGATPSVTTSMTVGDLEPGGTRSVPTTFTAPLTGRALLIATVSYADDFGDRRDFQAQEWTHVERPAATDETSELTLPEKVLAVVTALLGLS